MTENDPSSFDETFEFLQAHYLVHLSEQMRALSSYDRPARKGVFEGEERAALCALVHRLAGNGGTYGFPKISDAAMPLEKLLASDASVSCADISRKVAQLCASCAQSVQERKQSEDAAKKKRFDVSTSASSSFEQTFPVVLSLDDDPMIQLAFELLLKKDARLIVCHTACDGEALLRAHRPALLLLDEMMPGGVTGLSFLERIKKNVEFSSIPVVMVTASAHKEVLSRSLALGALDYIVKPFDPENFLSSVRKILYGAKNDVVLLLDDATLEKELLWRLCDLNCSVQVVRKEDALRTVSKNAVVVFDDPSLAGVFSQKDSGFSSKNIVFVKSSSQGVARSEEILKSIGIALRSNRQKGKA